MPQSYTMKLTKYLVCTVLLVVCVPNIEAKNLEKSLIKKNLCPNNALAKADLRGIRDVWGKIRESAIQTWNYIKSVGDFTKNKIKIFIDSVKKYAMDLKSKFEEKLQELKDKVNDIITDIYGTGELVKQCMEKDQENIENILKQLMASMGQCIAEEINDLNLLGNDEPEAATNQTMFIRYLDGKKELCENDMENVQECLCGVREEIFDDFTSMENKMLQNHFETKSIADDIKGTLVTCSMSNLIEATSLISNEIVEIAQCVIETKENEGESPGNNNI